MPCKLCGCLQSLILYLVFATLRLIAWRECTSVVPVPWMKTAARERNGVWPDYGASSFWRHFAALCDIAAVVGEGEKGGGAGPVEGNSVLALFSEPLEGLGCLGIRYFWWQLVNIMLCLLYWRRSGSSSSACVWFQTFWVSGFVSRFFPPTHVLWWTKLFSMSPCCLLAWCVRCVVCETESVMLIASELSCSWQNPLFVSVCVRVCVRVCV